MTSEQFDSPNLSFLHLFSHCLFGYRPFHGYFKDFDTHEGFPNVGSFVLGFRQSSTQEQSLQSRGKHVMAGDLGNSSPNYALTFQTLEL